MRPGGRANRCSAGPHRVAGVERGGVVPPLGERARDVVDRRTADLELQVVPGRAIAVVLVVELDGLRIAVVGSRRHDGRGRGRCRRRTRRHESGSSRRTTNDLLVVAATAPDPVVEQHLTARFVHQLREGQVLGLPEVHGLGMRAPEQPRTCTPRRAQLGEHLADRGAGPGELLVGVALPVGEVHPVAGLGVAQHVVQPARSTPPRRPARRRRCPRSTRCRHRDDGRSRWRGCRVPTR